MAISYEEYKKKYGKQVDNYYRQNVEKNMTTKEAKSALKYKTKVKEKAEQVLRNSLTTAGVKAGNSMLSRPDILPTMAGASNKKTILPSYNYANQKKELDQNQQKYNRYMSTDKAKKEVEDILSARDEESRVRSLYEQKKAAEDYQNASGLEKFLQKTGGAALRGVLGTITKSNNIVRDKEGNTYRLPDYAEYYQEQVSKNSGAVGRLANNVLYQSGRVLTSAALNSVVPGLGTGTYFSDMYIDQLDSAMRDGYTEDQAMKYATLGTATELITSKILGSSVGLFSKAGTTEGTINKVLKNFVSNNTVNKVLSSMGSEALEEFVQEYVEEINRNITLENEKALDGVFTQETLKNALYSGLIGALSSGGNIALTTLGQDGITKTTNQIIYDIERANGNSELSNTNKALVQNIIYEQILSGNNGQIDSVSVVNQFSNVKQQKIKAFTDSTLANFRNTKETQNMIDTVSKIIFDKNYNITFDNTLESGINGQIQGNTIKINPDSPYAGEFILMHEITHSIGTKEFKDMILKHEKNNPEFKKAVESLKETYNTDDVSDEVMCDIAAKYLGNQEFINSLKNTDKTGFQKLYDGIISVANKLTGGKNENLFVKNLANEWNNLYNESIVGETSGNEKIDYLIAGPKAKDNYMNAITDYYNSKYDQRVAQKYIEKFEKYFDENYQWFTDIKNNDKFEIDDFGFDLKSGIALQSNNAYKLGEIVNHNDLLFTFYPELKDYNVVFKDFKKETITGEFDFITNSININNNMLKNDKKEILATILHEIQHAIQYIEKFPHGTVASISQERYYKNIGEIEADDTAKRFLKGMDKLIRDSYVPESAKSTPKHSQYDNYIKNRDREISINEKDYKKKIKQYKIDKKKDDFYNKHEKLVDTVMEGVENLVTKVVTKNVTKTDNTSRLRRYTKSQELDNSSFFDTQNNTPLIDLKQKQLDIILKNNPAEDDYHTWIRTIDDIKTFEESLEDEEYKEYYESGEDFDESYSADMAREALSTGKITVYSSYPIEQGIFVSPSRMEAESYSGNGKVYSKEVNLTDIAWIDPTQGQYAKIDNTQYSKTNDEWYEYLNRQYQPKGTRTELNKIRNKVQKGEALNPNEISELTPEDANTTPILPNVNRNKIGDGDSKFAKNIRNKTKMLTEEQRELLANEEEVAYYDKITNKESLEKAFNRLENGSFETEKWFNKLAENADAIDVAEGWILLKQYAEKNDTNGMVEVAKKLRDIGTKAGQTVQAFNIMERLTPEGMVKYAQSELMEAYDKMVKGQTKKWIESHKTDFDLTPDEVRFIMETMEDVSTMEDGYDKRVKLAEIQKIMTDKLPPSKGSGIKSWMRISMLFNPKTQVRNIAGNAIIAPVNYFGDLFASAADKAVSKMTGVRTTGKANVKKSFEGFKEGLYQSYNDFQKGINTRNIEGNRFELTEGRSFNNDKTLGKALNKVDALLSFMLDAGDRGFYEAAFTNSINNQMILNNTTEITQDMIDIATNEALQRTWQDNNNYTKSVLEIRRIMNKLNVAGYGLGDILIPFAKTPANLTKAIIDYSPVGFVRSAFDVKKIKNAIETDQFTPQMQHDFVQKLGKATAGTMLYVLGYALAQAGVISGENDEDKDISNFLKNTLGISSYSIKVGDKSFTYDWAQPIAAPLSITTNIVNSKKEDQEQALLEGIANSLDSAGSILLEQSFLQSINDVFNNNDGVVSGLFTELYELPTRAIPTFSKQIADLIDGTQRQTYVVNNPLASSVMYGISKVPVASKLLVPSVDTLGREIQKYGGKNNIFNVFFNPANVNTENVSEAAKEIYSVYKSTGDKTVMPRVTDNTYENSDGVRLPVTQTQKEKWQKMSGSIVEENIELLMKDSKYNKLLESDKAAIMSNIVNYAYNKAKSEVLGTNMANQYNKVNEYVANGGTAADYYLNKEEIDYSLEYPERYSVISQITNYEDYTKYNKDITELKETYTTTEQRKNAVISYVDELDLNVIQKAMLIRLNYSSFKDYDKEIINYINNQNLTKDEKIMIYEKLGFKVKDGKVYLT